MLVVTDQAKTRLAETMKALNEMKDKSLSRTLRWTLARGLLYLHNYYKREETKTTLGYDFAPFSFSFLISKIKEDGTLAPWFNGGLIFHGLEDYAGGGPNFCVSLDGRPGWQIHT